jgi:hypothetical protein
MINNGYTSRGTRPNLSINNTENPVEIILMAPVDAIAY